MSTGPKHEIVIIRRGGHGDHDDHHGGVWKIAFADFMTAMMAFFLVMWLISANDKTRASVARYFNPVKLVDSTTQPRGLHDSKKDDSGITAASGKEVAEKSKDAKDAKDGKTQESKAQSSKANETASGREKRLDAEMRSNPLAALAEIAADHGASEKADSVHTGTLSIGRKGGAAFRDPFAPPPPRQVSEDISDDELLAAKSKTAPSSLQDAVKPASETKAAESVGLKSAEAKAAQLAQQLKSALPVASRAGAGPDLRVRATKEGLLVSLTDTGSFSMFTNGSAVPSRRVVLLMEGVAKILATKPGAVVIRGFTDNKQFRQGRYDNWHLSIDRAQTAHYMLLRGGLPDTRIASVEGLADRAAKAGVDPSSPLNRRIEILLKDDAS